MVIGHEDNTLRFFYSSLKSPWALIKFNFLTKEKIIIRQDTVQDYNPDDYISERVFAKAKDGVLLPINFFYKKDIVLDGSNPLHLESYSSYGYNFPEAAFGVSKLILAEKGFVYAGAHVRGGGFYGKKWHDDGRLLNKMNSYTDLISCGEYLIKEKYTSSEKFVLKGESCGGTMVLGVANMRPDLFNIIISSVPVSDVIGQMLDHSKWTFKEWHYSEWGNPYIKEEYEYLKTWCPYQNLSSQNYPNILVFAGINDTRVNFWIPLKYVAKLREFNKGDNDLFISLGEAGHFGSGNDNLALEFAYIFDKLGIEYEKGENNA